LDATTPERLEFVMHVVLPEARIVEIRDEVRVPHANRARDAR
jgi:hypothetical protein